MILFRICAEGRSWTLLFFHLFCCSTLGKGSPWNSGAESHQEASPLLRFLNLPANTEYEIVSPYEVSHHGVYVSHEVAHHQRRRRRRRSLTADAASSNADGGGEAVHFRLSGLGQDFHMELREASQRLIAPGFTIQVLGKNGTKSLRAYRQDDLCFYQGSLRSKVNSSVALSTCTGMICAEITSDTEQRKQMLDMKKHGRPLSRKRFRGVRFTVTRQSDPH
ncbi:hypothetical protein F2P81_001712 [Scophthalmus maximus]|uniref:Peptidase M12B propeptide domain-containing protein n=1 Tax=Scophthalmus maximus TaxID=52904 RepID=A0A6A4TGX1_SCOMX|nr:hypothetical protein F2P81_001712 [Scophthalmus maximus]